jgi:hypothetical protein
MLRRVRTAPVVRLALCVAGFLAIGASFGLHPEPGANFGSSPPGIAVAKLRTLEARHGCVACLTHGAALASPLLGILLARSPSELASLLVDPSSHGRLAGMDLPGRSPPPDRS